MVAVITLVMGNALGMVFVVVLATIVPFFGVMLVPIVVGVLLVVLGVVIFGIVVLPTVAIFPAVFVLAFMIGSVLFGFAIFGFPIVFVVLVVFMVFGLGGLFTVVVFPTLCIFHDFELWFFALCCLAFWLLMFWRAFLFFHDLL